MSLAKINNFANDDTDILAVQTTVDALYNNSYSLTEYNSTTVPAIAAGSKIEVNGSLYRASSEEAISTTDPVTSSTVADGTVYICMIPSGDASTCTAAFTATAPTWSDSKQGWYGTGDYANYKYIGWCNKNSSSYALKNKYNVSKKQDIGDSVSAEFTGSTNAYTYAATTFDVSLNVFAGDIIYAYVEMEGRSSSGSFSWAYCIDDTGTSSNISIASTTAGGTSNTSYSADSCYAIYIVIEDGTFGIRDGVRGATGYATGYARNRELTLSILNRGYIL